MKNFIRSLVVVSLLVAGCSSSQKRTNAPVSVDTKKGDASNLRPYQEKELPNGLKILYVLDNSLPYVSYSMLLKTGSSSDPTAYPGLSLFVSEMLDKGTAKRSATEIAESLGRIGADFSTSVTNDYSMVSASSLSMHADRLLTDMVEIVTAPAFSDTEVTRMRKQILAAIQKRVDNPDSFADTAWEDFLYETHPYARPTLGTSRSVAGLKRRSVIQHYIRHYRPNNAILAVTGQITPEIAQKVEAAFGSWEKRELTPITYPAFPSIDKIEIRVVDSPGLGQAQIRMGHKGIQRKNEDFVPLRVANTILGGAFASRLMDRVRKKLGLTYGISSGFDARLDYGPFEISTFTKTETVGQAIKETLEVLKEYREKGATAEEVSRTKGYLKGLFPTSIETAEKFSFNLLLLRLYGIPDSYLSTYLRQLDSVDANDVNSMVMKYMDPSNLKIFIYGNAKEILPQVQEIGVVEVKKAAEFQ
jgi:zinc protease